MIELNAVSKTYVTHAGNVTALKNVSLKINAGENIIVVGKSGSGKSTLLNLISGIDRPDKGEIKVNQQSLTDLSENALALWRGKNVGIVFQFYQLIPTLSAIDNILFVMDIVGKVPVAERIPFAEQLLSKVMLIDKRNKFINELSGGEKQRIAIARAMANKPPVIVADEPTGNLDSVTSAQIDDLFLKLNEEGITLVTVTHENVSERIADKVIYVKDGMIVDVEQRVK